MSEIVKHNLKNRLIEITSSGTVTDLEIKQSFVKIRDIISKHQVKIILVDHTKATSLPSDAMAFNLGTTMAYTFKELKIAVVIPEHLENKLNFLEKVIAVRGGNIKIFKDHSMALEWLKVNGIHDTF